MPEASIKLYAAGSLVIDADESDVKLDLSSADAMMDEEFDETKLDRSGDTQSSWFFKVVAFLALAVAVLYFFRKRIDRFVASHPKYEKTWVATCKAGKVLTRGISKKKA